MIPPEDRRLAADTTPPEDWHLAPFLIANFSPLFAKSLLPVPRSLFKATAGLGVRVLPFLSSGYLVSIFRLGAGLEARLAFALGLALGAGLDDLLVTEPGLTLGAGLKALLATEARPFGGFLKSNREAPWLKSMVPGNDPSPCRNKLLRLLALELLAIELAGEDDRRSMMGADVRREEDGGLVLRLVCCGGLLP